MRKHLAALLILLIFGVACSHVTSKIHKKWQTDRNTIFLKDLSGKKSDSIDPGLELKLAMEESFRNSLYIVAVDPSDSKFQLKYKVTRFDPGNRLKRLFTFGIDDGSRARMEVKAALYNQEGTMLGAWEIQTDVKGGPTGGSTQTLFNKAAAKILEHLRGY